MNSPDIHSLQRATPRYTQELILIEWADTKERKTL